MDLRDPKYLLNILYKLYFKLFLSPHKVHISPLGTHILSENSSIFFKLLNSLSLARWFLINFLFNKNKYQISNKIYFWTCLLNTYYPYEIETYLKIKEFNYKEILLFLPVRLSKDIHLRNRLNYPNKCTKAINILANKSELLKLAPKKCASKNFLVEINKNNQLLEKHKSWLYKDLSNKGVILKPNVGGYSSINVIHLKFIKGKLLFRFIDKSKYEFNEFGIYKNLNLEIIKEFWIKKTHFKKDFIVMPYIEHTNSFPSSPFSTVFRVITTKKNEFSSIKVESSWFEIFKSDYGFFLLDYNLHLIPYFKKIFNFNLDNFSPYVDYCKKRLCENVLSASKDMHNILPTIDTVAWDWIISDDGPILLEGNSSYSIFVPQLISFLNNNNYDDKIN